MITLGDVAIYSTYTYVNQMVREMGFETEIVREFLLSAAVRRWPR